MINEFITLALKNLRRQVPRTGVLTLSIALFVCVVVLGLSFVLGVNSGVKRSSDRLGADLVVIPVGAPRDPSDILLERATGPLFLNRNLIERLRKIDGIAELTCQTYLTVIGGKADAPEVRIVAFDQDSDFILRPWMQKAIGPRLERGEAIAGSRSLAAARSGLTRTAAGPLGDRLRVVDRLEETGTGLDNAIFIGRESMPDIAQRGTALPGADQVSVIFIKVKRGFDPYAVGRVIEGEILDVDVVARRDIGKSVVAALRDIRLAFAAMVILAALLSAFLAWAVVSAVAQERTREVGILRAVGAKGSHIVSIFMIEVIIVGLAGGLIGSLAGNAISAVLKDSFMLLKDLPAGLRAPERVLIAAVAVLAGTAVCVLGALSPIRRLIKLEPLASIREGPGCRLRENK